MSDSSESQYISVDLFSIRVGEPLPCRIFVFIDQRFITFRGVDDVVDSTAIDRFLAKRVRQIFVRTDDFELYEGWLREVPPPAEPETIEEHEVRKVQDDLRRTAMDIFSTEPPTAAMARALDVSKKLADQVMKQPFAIRAVLRLQSYSQGTLDHSVNVSILSSYLAMNMGYSHSVILQNVALGGLLHDVGKVRVPLLDSDDDETVILKMRQHPEIGLSVLSEADAVEAMADEVKWIVSQHHEAQDGSGYPKGLRGGGIYDLSKIVSIANTFDELVGEAAGPLLNRQRAAIKTLTTELPSKFDPSKLEKAVKILSLGI